MRALYDTSVLVAAVVKPHPMHTVAFPWLERACNRDIDLVVSTHSLAEVYAVLTALPVRPRISPRSAQQIIAESIETNATDLVELQVADYQEVVTRLAERGLAGGIVYDALIARAAEKAGVDQLVTFNDRDFRRIWPDNVRILVVRPGQPSLPTTKGT